MTTRDQISVLESRQLELLSIMQESDAHASRCEKLGMSFAETYPEELEAYQEANAEFHVNEERLVELYEKLREEEEEEQPDEQSESGE